MTLKKPIHEKTNKNKTKSSLRFSHFRLSSLNDSTDDAIALTTPDGIITDWNKSAQSMYGLTKDEVLGKPLWELAPASRQNLIKKIIDRVKKGERLLHYEMERTDQEGKIFSISLNMAPLIHSGEAPSGIIAVSRDITERKKSFAEQERYRNFLENIDDACFETDLRGNVTYVNNATTVWNGLTRSEMIGVSYRDYIKPEEVKRIVKTFKEIYRTGESGVIRDCEINDRNGRSRFTDMSVSLIRNTAGHPAGFRAICRDTTQRKKEQTELERYRDFIENTNDACFETDRKGNITFANKAAAERSAITPQEMIGDPYSRYTTNPEDTGRVYKIFHEIYRTGTSDVISDLKLNSRDGRSRFVEMAVSPISDASGSPVGFRIISRDVTARKKAEEDLQLSEARYRNLFEYSKAVMLLIEPHTTCIVDANLAACTYYGYTKEELLRKKITDINTATPFEIQAEMNKARLEQRNHFYFSHRMKNGFVKPVEVFAGTVEIGGERLIYSIIHDITERREAEDALRQSEEKYRTIIQNMQDSYFECNLQGKFTFVNDTACTILGYTREELLNIDYQKLISPETADKVRQLYEQTRQTGTPSTLVDYEIICRDGGMRVHQLHVALMRSAGGEPIGYRTVSRDVTKRHQAEEALLLMQFSMDHAPESILLIDDEGYVTYGNHAACTSMGYSREELVKMKIFDIDPDFPVEGWEKHKKDLKRLGQMTSEGRHRKKDGSFFPVEVTTNYLEYKGRFLGIAFDRDITERKRAEEALRQSEERIRVLFNNIPVPTVVWKERNDDLVMVEYNDAALKYTSGTISGLTGKTVEECYPHASHIASDMHQCFSLRTNMEKGFWFGGGPAGEKRYVTVKYAFAPPDNVIMHINDMTAQKKAEENLRHISIHDALTGLYNRFYSDTEIDRIKSSRLRPISFIVADLNDLKIVNDRHGHAAGDRYIKNTADLLRQTFRPEDMIARIGGDEFIVLLPLVDDKTCAQALARLEGNLAQFNQTARQPLSLAAGFSTARTGDNIDTAIAEADRRMYEKKAKMKSGQETADV